MNFNIFILDIRRRTLVFTAAHIFSILLLTSTLRSQTPGGIALLSDGLSAFKLYGSRGNDSLVRLVNVEGQPFSQALRVNTLQQTAQSAQFGLNAGINASLKRGDLLWISFMSRSIRSSRETGESLIELRLDQLVNGNYMWPPHLERGLSIGKAWTLTSIPFRITKDVTPADVKLVIRFDNYPGEFEMGPVTLLNYGTSRTLEELPRTVVNYEGSEPDAAWRKAANSRIELYRKADLSVKVIDGRNKIIPGAKVSVKMTRIDFNWGTATNSARLLESSFDSKKYRDTLIRYFNQVVLENEMKSKTWERFNYAQTSAGIQWLNDRGITVRGHVMVWPSWKNSATSLAVFKNDSAALRKAIFRHISEQTGRMKGRFVEWDVINEPYANHDFMDILGKEEMVAWFKAARAGDPGVKLFLNEYTMFHGEGPESASEQYFKNVQYLLSHHAPIDAIGEQGHIGGTPPGISKVIERLNRFATLGLPIQISEFDINSNDDEFKARYLGDFMTAMFSIPAVKGFVQWGFWEGQHWFPVAALWDKNWKIRAHGKVFTELVGRTWTTNETLITGSSGEAKTRAFKGMYEILVQYKDRQVTKQFSLTDNNHQLTISL